MKKLNNLSSEVLAKSNGTTLEHHSKAVAKFAEAMYNVSYAGEKDPLKESVRISALLHDIGKCTSFFAERLKSTKDDQADLLRDKKISKIKFGHNEVGWAFLSRHLKLNEDVRELVLDSVYWHHGINHRPNEKLTTHTDDVLACVTEQDILVMKDFVKLVLGEEYLGDEEGGERPDYFRRDKFNSNRPYFQWFVRSIIISADRLASSVSADIDDDKILDMVSRTMTRESDLAITSNGYAGKRFEEQCRIIEEADKTTIVKAPAGFGKTVLGLLWAKRTDRRIIWVCPRNMVAQSVYHSVISDMKAMGMNASVELFLGGEVVERNSNSNIDDFGSDIVITNIDSILFPTVRNNVAKHQFMVNNSDIVFDEYHELITENIMFACFLNVMKIRHRFTKARTILLSATPIDFRYIWDSHAEKTKVLPSEGSHYPAVHQKPYLVKIENEVSAINGTSLVISNSISEAQRLKSGLRAGSLVHSGFSDEHRFGMFDKLIDEFGKQSKRHLNKTLVVSTHILQAALDISFPSLHDSIMSPESFLQRLGRCDRWGDYEHSCTLFLRFDENPSEKAVRKMLYDLLLSKKWFDRLAELDGKMVTLDEIYKIYNDHSSKNGAEIKQWIEKKKNESAEGLEKIFPRQYYLSGQKDETKKTADSNPLRSNGNQFFYIAKRSDGNGWSDAFSGTLYGGDFGEDWNEPMNIDKHQRKIIKSLVDSGDERFDYKKINGMLKKGGYLNWDFYAKSSKTPYIRSHVLYDDEFGMIKESLLQELRPSMLKDAKSKKEFSTM